MPTRAQVTTLLDQGHSYESAARELHVPPGLAYMIATGLPADGGAGEPEARRDAHRPLPTSSQQLVNPPAFNPTHSESVVAWVRERARRELRQGA